MSEERLMVETWNQVEKALAQPAKNRLTERENATLVDILAGLSEGDIEKLILQIPGVTHVLIMRESDQFILKSANEKP